jgi:peptidoglycan/xylan/chitin deacetylase (PgdA/CDA1 family)
MYHQVVDDSFSSPHKIYITDKNFEKHLAFFKKAGFTTLTFKDLYEFKMGSKDFSKFPSKPLILTFDDGYVNNLTTAVPLLEKYGFKAVIYLLANHHKTNYWDENSGAPQLPLMTAEQRQQISQHMEIGSHGFDHKKLSEMNLDEARFEITESKKVLEKEFNQQIYSYAYTYGIRHEFSSLLAYGAGYKYAVNTTTGGFHHEEDPYSLFRVSIFPTDDESSLKRKTKSWYRKYYYLKRKE